jgi:hypothetical protein
VHQRAAVRPWLGRLLALSLLAGPAAASAAPDVGIPGKGEGTITILGGLRSVPMGSFLSDQTNAGLRPWKTVFSPGLLAILGYAPEPDFHVGVTLGYGLDRVQMTTGALQTRSFTILLGADTSLFKRSWVSFYVGGGLGYSLNTLSQNANNVESNSSAGYVAAGLRFPIAPRFALVVEDRYTLSSAGLPSPGQPLNYAGSEPSLNVGGNLISIGLMFHYMDPEDSKRPYHQ